MKIETKPAVRVLETTSSLSHLKLTGNSEVVDGLKGSSQDGQSHMRTFLFLSVYEICFETKEKRTSKEGH